jgi:hypothetical protein
MEHKNALEAAPQSSEEEIGAKVTESLNSAK